jgi:hypothetical protein
MDISLFMVLDGWTNRVGRSESLEEFMRGFKEADRRLKTTLSEKLSILQGLGATQKAMNTYAYWVNIPVEELFSAIVKTVNGFRLVEDTGIGFRQAHQFLEKQENLEWILGGEMIFLDAMMADLPHGVADVSRIERYSSPMSFL